MASKVGNLTDLNKKTKTKNKTKTKTKQKNKTKQTKQKNYLKTQTDLQEVLSFSWYNWWDEDSANHDWCIWKDVAIIKGKILSNQLMIKVSDKIEEGRYLSYLVRHWSM